MLLPLLACAQTVEIEGVCYHLVHDNNVAEVVWKYPLYEGDVVIPESFTYDETVYSVTSIGNTAFLGCSELTSVEIPNSVTTIGEAAFTNCVALASVVIPKSVTSLGHFVFDGCENLGSIVVDVSNTKYDSRGNCNAVIETETNILVAGCKNTVIPNSVTSIGYSAFCGCLGLTSITIPNSVTSIGVAAFEGCSSMTSITIPSSVTIIERSAFARCISLPSMTIPNGVTSIGENAFYYCTELASIDIPSSVTSIGYFVFEQCKNLSSIVVEVGNPKFDSRDNCNAIIESETNTLVAGCKNTIIPNSVTAIGMNAFYNCVGLTNISIPASVTSIGQSSFAFCSELTSIVIPSSVSLVGLDAFGGCNKLETIVVDAGNTVYDSRDNCNAVINTSTNTLVVGCKNTVIPNSVTCIDTRAFHNCTSLKYINIPNSVTTVRSGAFEGSGLTSVTIPSSVTTINHHAFDKIDNIEGVYCYATDVPTTNGLIFDEYAMSQTTLHVPAGSIDAYKASDDWNGFKVIVAIEEETTEDEIKITSAGQTTWCSAYDLDFTGIEGIKAYTAGGYDRVSGTIWLMRVNQVPANEGILIIGTPGEYHVPHKSTGTYYANLMVGTIQPITIYETDGDYTNYYLSSGDSGVGFYKVNGSVDLKANRAYLPLLKGTTQAGTRFIGLGFEDDGTTNLTPALSKGEGEGAWYTLQGQRVAKPGKGIYIRNGKKVVIK